MLADPTCALSLGCRYYVFMGDSSKARAFAVRVLVVILLLGSLAFVTWGLLTNSRGADLANIFALPVAVVALLLVLLPTMRDYLLPDKPPEILEVVAARHPEGTILRIKIHNRGRSVLNFTKCTLASTFTSLSDVQFSGGGYRYSLIGPVYISTENRVAAKVREEDSRIAGATFPAEGEMANSLGYVTGLKMRFPVDIESQVGATDRVSILLSNSLVRPTRGSSRTINLPLVGSGIDSEYRSFGFLAVELESKNRPPITFCDEVVNDAEPPKDQPRCSDFTGMETFAVPGYWGW